MGFILFLICGGAFFYLFRRINRLEEIVADREGARRSEQRIAEEKPLPERGRGAVAPLPYSPSAEILKPQQAEIPEAVKPIIKEEPETVPEKSVSEKKIDQNFELKLGSKLATGIGSIAIIFAVGFFLQYAFANNWINETARVVLGIIGGIILLLAGNYASRRFPTYGQIITGGGLGVLYLSLYAGFNVYGIMSQPVSFIGMAIVTAVGVFLAVRGNSVALAGFAQVGGFLTPLLLSGGGNNPHALFLYIAILDIGILAIARWKLWRLLTFMSFTGTVIIYSLWLFSSYTTSQLAVAEGYATLFFLIFLGTSLLQHFVQKSPQTEADLALTTVNPAVYFLISSGIINPVHHEWLGFFTAFLSAFYFMLAFAAGRKTDASFRFQQFLAGIALVFLVIAVPVQFDGKWVTLGWGIEALVLTFLGFQIASKNLRIFAQGAFVLTLLNLFFFHIIQRTSGSMSAWANERFYICIACAVFLALASLIYWLKRSEISADEISIPSFLLISSGLVPLVAISMEILQFFDTWWLSVVWSLGAWLMMIFAFLLKNFSGRVFAFTVFIAAVCRLRFFDAHLGPGDSAWINSRCLVFAAAILSSAAMFFLYKNFREDINKDEFSAGSGVLTVLPYSLLLWVTASEIFDFHGHFWFPICWALISLSGGVIALYLNNFILRLAVYLTFAVNFFYLLSAGTSINLGTFTLLFNTRVLSFLGLVFAATAYLMFFNRKKEGVSEDERKIVQPAMFLGVNFLLLWLLSREIIDHFNSQMFRLSIEERRLQNMHFKGIMNAALSVCWASYAILLIIFGIIKRMMIARFLAIFLFGIVIFKVFLYDSANLGNSFYRIVSFATLGLILLLCGYLYSRYPDRIAKFIRAN